MSVINDVKKLLARSRLFVSQQVLDKNQKVHKRGKRSGEIVKMGQGGTLDPLADGVLGTLFSVGARMFECHQV